MSLGHIYIHILYTNSFYLSIICDIHSSLSLSLYYLSNLSVISASTQQSVCLHITHEVKERAWEWSTPEAGEGTSGEDPGGARMDFCRMCKNFLS